LISWRDANDTFSGRYAEKPKLRGLMMSTLREFEGFAEQLQALHRQAYNAYAPIVADLIQHNIQDAAEIERVLDGLLDFCGDSDIVELFRTLCRHYWDINPQATAEYIRYYRDDWDADHPSRIVSR
jgi:hypothetical protein